MLEIGCNVVVLSIDAYEELKKQVRAAEQREKDLQKAVYYKKSYWDDDAPELMIDLKVLEPKIIQAWEDYKGDNKEKFKFLGIDPEHDKYTVRIDTYLVERIPEPEPEPDPLAALEGDGTNV